MLQDFQLPSLRQESQSNGLGQGTRLVQDQPLAFTLEFEELVLAVINDLGKALSTTVAQRCRFLQLLPRAVAHCDSFLSTMLNSLSDYPSWDVWMVEVFKEAETFKRVAAANLP